jgi:hypothetical protein
MDNSNLWTRAGAAVRHATQLGELASLATPCAVGRTGDLLLGGDQSDQKKVRNRTRRSGRVRRRRINLLQGPDIASLRNPLAFPVDVIHQDIFA